MSEIKTLIVDEVYNGIRIDKYLTEILSDKSRSFIKRYFDEERIYLNDRIVKPSAKVYTNDVITYTDVEIIETTISKQDIPLDIVYEDSDVVVVNKPSGMVVHPAFGHYEGTLVNALMYHCKDLSSINGVIRAGIVHRIDKDTSGLLVVCKNDASHESISEQLKAKTTTRKYYALVSGVIEHEFGKINAPIGRNPKNRQQQAVVEDGKPSITHFKVIERLNDATLIECVLETGRTHQIRVHLAYIGHPVLGDPIYGLRKHISPNGQYLHAKTLGFIHPTTKEYMEFDSELPKDFVEKLESLR